MSNPNKLSIKERIEEILVEIELWSLGDKICPLVGVSRLEKAQASLDILVYEERKANKESPAIAGLMETLNKVDKLMDEDYNR